LTEFLLERLTANGKAKPLSVPPRAMSVLKDHDWPGNVRELENGIEHAIVCSRGGAVEAGASPSAKVGKQADRAQHPKRSRPSVSAADEKGRLQRAVEAGGWNRGLAAARLRIDRTTLWRRMRRWCIVAPRN
jgi:transcriptional regulator of acetoin/glycerol metabolism